MPSGPGSPGACPRCGFAHDPGQAFCTGCGADLRGEAPTGPDPVAEARTAPRPAVLPTMDAGDDEADDARYDVVGFDALEPPAERTAEAPTERTAAYQGPTTYDGYQGYGPGYQEQGYPGQGYAGDEYGYGDPGYPPPQPEAPPARRRTPAWVLAVASALAVIVLAAMVGGGWLLFRPDGGGKGSGEGPTASASGSSSPSGSPSPVGAGVAAKVRPSVAALAVVGCPRGASSNAVALDATHLVVPAAVVSGAARPMVIGAGEPEQADVLGVDGDRGVAVLRTSADVAKGATLAGEDARPGTPVVVVGPGGSGGSGDTKGTVASGEDGATHVAAGSTLVPGSPVAVAGAQVAGMTTAGGGLVPASVLKQTLDRFRDADPVRAASCSQPAGPSDVTGLVASTPDASGDARAVVDRLVAYYTAIDRHQLAQAYAMRSVRSGYGVFASGYRTTYDVGLRIETPQVSGDRATTHLSFTSTQNAEDAPAGTHQTCTRWEIDQQLDRRGGKWLVGPSSNSTHQGC